MTFFSFSVCVKDQAPSRYKASFSGRTVVAFEETSAAGAAGIKGEAFVEVYPEGGLAPLSNSGAVARAYWDSATGYNLQSIFLIVSPQTLNKSLLAYLKGYDPNATTVGASVKYSVSALNPKSYTGAQVFLQGNIYLDNACGDEDGDEGGDEGEGPDQLPDAPEAPGDPCLPAQPSAPSSPQLPTPCDPSGSTPSFPSGFS